MRMPSAPRQPPTSLTKELHCLLPRPPRSLLPITHLSLLPTLRPPPHHACLAVPTITTDRIYCKMLAHGAVHGAFAGYTGITVGLVNTHYCYLPIPILIQAPRRVDPQGELWNRLRASMGMPNFE